MKAHSPSLSLRLRSISISISVWLCACLALAALQVWLGSQAANAAPAVGLDAAPQRAISEWRVTLTGSLELTPRLYLPLVARFYSYTQPLTPTTPVTELRAVWVSRYDWTRYGHAATVTDVQHVVDTAAEAGFNALFFQVRAAGDAYYTPGLEPWASRLSGTLGPTLGQYPGWDPLAEIISRAHASNVAVHAWFNVYPAWMPPPSSTYGLLTPTLGISPPHMLNRFTYGRDGGYGLGYTWRVYDQPTSTGYMPVQWGQYLWASPAVPQVQEHIAAVVADVVARYAVDGVHLDNVRYPGVAYSLDPSTLDAYARDPLSLTMTLTDWRPDFQRAQINQLVLRILTQTHAAQPTLTVSAAVWPSYQRGYTYYYQDSQGWMLSQMIDAVAPMLYSSDVITDLAAWTTAAADFQAHSGGGAVLPGIGIKYAGECVPFEAVAARIEAARELGTAGQAVFSLSELEGCGYVDDLRQGPYAGYIALQRRNVP